jgi:hypothetical protein
MGFLAWIKQKLLRKKVLEQAIESDLERFESPQSASERSEALQIDRGSLQLGFAAGYTGRSLRNIEDSLIRIESLMPTKDWLENQATEMTSKLLTQLSEMLKSHEEASARRSEAIMSALNRLESLASRVPQPLKAQILREVEEIKEKVELTPTMEKVLSVIKEKGEISYKDLAQILGYKSESTIRGLLSEMCKRTTNLERFMRNGRGWVKYVGEEKDVGKVLSEMFKD